MTVLDDWVAAACAELALDPAELPVPAVLDLARDVAHQVVRPGAPVTAYLLGLAVGRGADPAEALRRLTGLAGRWAQRSEDGGVPSPAAQGGSLSDPGPG